MQSIILSVDDTGQIIRHVGLDAIMDEMVNRLDRAFRAFDPKKTVVPTRSGFEYCHPGVGLLEWMPAMELGRQATIKVVGYHPSNPAARGLPTILSNISAYDTATGHLIGLADGTFVTALRTGAASALATRVLAGEEARCLGMIGCGAQAVAQLHALSRIRQFERVLAYDRDAAVAADFVTRAAHLGLPDLTIRPCPLDEVIRTADVLCTATSVEVGNGPVFRDVDCKPWLHVNAVGSDFPGKIEIPVSLLQRSLVCPDFQEQAIHEGECQQLFPEQIGPSLADIVKDADAYASARSSLTVFDSTGWALEDHVALNMLLEYARKLDLGTRVRIESMASDPRDPYAFARAVVPRGRAKRPGRATLVETRP